MLRVLGRIIQMRTKEPPRRTLALHGLFDHQTGLLDSLAAPAARGRRGSGAGSRGRQPYL